MTVLCGSLSLLLALVLASFTTSVGMASSSDMRAQITADAAALAAVAEAGPYGDTLPEYQARRFVEANGGRLIECLCERYATAAQVRVSVEGVIAEARAVFNPDAVLPEIAPWDAAGLHPTLAAAVDRLVSVSRGAVTLVSGYRSRSEQVILWERALKRYGSAEAADDWVAPPGNSMHERGLAVDLGGDLALAVELVEDLRLPLYRPLENEPWHFELVGSRATG